jgi:acyl carrier protein
MDVHERLTDVFRTVFGDTELSLAPATTAEDIPAWDSLAHINLMFAIEEEFSVRFAGNELAEMENVAELEAYLRTHGR